MVVSWIISLFLLKIKRNHEIVYKIMDFIHFKGDKYLL